MHLRRACLLVGAAAALVASGCSTLDLRENITLLSWGSKPQIPTRMTDFWTDTVLYQPGLPGVRGFGGRIMFYNDSSESPIMVEGTLTVFAYDESRGQVSYSAPDKKYIFTPEQLPKHYSQSELGHSYSFWLPWDEVGGPRKKICLIARFEPLKGHMIVSQPCRKVLPGEPVETQTAAMGPSAATGGDSPAEGGVRQVSHVEPVGPAQPLRTPPATFTIDVPPRFLRLPAAGQSPAADPAAPTTVPGAPPRTSPGPSAGTPKSGDTLSLPTGATSGLRPLPLEPSMAARDANHPSPYPGAEPATRFERRRPLVQRAPIAPRVHDPVRRQPLPAAWLSSLPPTPRSDWQGPTPATSEDAGPQPR